jgi:preprotein translocase subunit SecY
MKRPTTCASTAASSRASGPGKNTAEYMNKILTKITVVGGLVSVDSFADAADHDHRHQAAAPAAVGNWIDAHFPRWLLDGLGVTFISAERRC